MKSNALPRPTGPLDENYVDACLYSEPGDEPASAILIGETFDKYMAAHDYRKSEKHVERVTATFNQFLTANKLHENLVLQTITKAHGRQWIEYMQTPQKFPARAVPKAVTIQSKLQIVRHFLQYCVSQDWLTFNPFEGLSLPARVVSASRTRKEGFSDVELAVIFKALKEFQVPGGKWNPNREPYVRAPRGVSKRELAKIQTADGLVDLKHVTPARVEFYHVALLLAFTGARCTEMLQLDTKDVYQVEGIWMANIVTLGDDGKRVKNLPSHRKVPLHSQVLPIFLPWFQQQTGPKLFPLLHPRSEQIVSRWFSYLLKREGLKRRENSLHSFRHTMTVKLIEARTYPPLRNRLLGHVIEKGVEGATYGRTAKFTMKELSEALEAVKFPML